LTQVDGSGVSLSPGKPSFGIDAGKLAEEARFDGIFVLRTNPRVTPLQAVLRYRDLLHVEDLFSRTKAIMRTRPIFHSSDAAIRGHVFSSLTGAFDAEASRRSRAELLFHRARGAHERADRGGGDEGEAEVAIERRESTSSGHRGSRRRTSQLGLPVEHRPPR
jgi:hypothetical protein